MAHSNGKLISELKVQELRLELARRELETSGIKGVLVARLEESLNEQDVDINTYLFTTTSDTTQNAMVTTETQNNDGAAADETGKTGEARKEAVQENVKSMDVEQNNDETNAKNLVDDKNTCLKVETPLASPEKMSVNDSMNEKPSVMQMLEDLDELKENNDIKDTKNEAILQSPQVILDNHAHRQFFPIHASHTYPPVRNENWSPNSRSNHFPRHNRSRSPCGSNSFSSRPTKARGRGRGFGSSRHNSRPAFPMKTNPHYFQTLRNHRSPYERPFNGKVSRGRGWKDNKRGGNFAYSSAGFQCPQSRESIFGNVFRGSDHRFRDHSNNSAGNNIFDLQIANNRFVPTNIPHASIWLPQIQTAVNCETSNTLGKKTRWDTPTSFENSGATQTNE